MIALVLTAALSAQALDGFAVHAQPADVIAWLETNRDTLVRLGGATVVGRDGNVVRVRRDGIEARLRESGEHDADSAVYRVRLEAATRKLRSWNTEVRVQPVTGGTWISLSVSATVYGPGEARVQAEIKDGLARVRAYVMGRFR